MSLTESRQFEPLDHQWAETARRACCNPSLAVTCPVCRKAGVRATWQLTSLTRRIADVELACHACAARAEVQIELPSKAADYHPVARLANVPPALVEDAASMMQFIHDHQKLLPAAAWLTNPLWISAGWSATAYRWHPTSEQPPVMGFVFENAEAGRELFRSWNAQQRNADELEEIRIAVIEGGIPGQRPGYSVHLCPDPVNSLIRATAEGVVVDLQLAMLGQTRRMHPIAGEPPMLPHFRSEFEKHGEYLLAPITRRENGQKYFDIDHGIVKSAIYFRRASHIEEGDIDSIVFRTPSQLLHEMTT